MMESVGMQGVEGSDSQYAPEVQMPRYRRCIHIHYLYLG